MDAAIIWDWTELVGTRQSRAHADDQMRAVQLARENMQLLEENERLRQENADLAASAEMWIRLYEAALSRVKQPRPVFSGFGIAATRQ